MRLNRGLDRAICPGCGAVYTRDKLAQGIWASPWHGFTCYTCGFEYTEFPFRPLTIQEILDGKISGPHINIALEKYAISLLEIYYGFHKCSCGDLAEYEHLRDKRRKTRKDCARIADLEKELERIYGPQTEEEKDREKDLKWIAERLKESLGNGRRPTGIRDNNGRMICEGDLVLWHNTEGTDVRHEVTYNSDRACFMLGNMSFDRLLDSGFHQPPGGLNPTGFEVIEKRRPETAENAEEKTETKRIGQ